MAQHQNECSSMSVVAWRPCGAYICHLDHLSLDNRLVAVVLVKHGEALPGFKKFKNNALKIIDYEQYAEYFAQEDLDDAGMATLMSKTALVKFYNIVDENVRSTSVGEDWDVDDFRLDNVWAAVERKFDSSRRELFVAQEDGERLKVHDDKQLQLAMGVVQKQQQYQDVDFLLWFGPS